MIAVIDYGMGNLRSVQKALEAVGGRTRIFSRGEGLRRAGKIVFPGVGAFDDAMEELRRRAFIEPIREAISEGRLFLGLCLGMQLLFDESEEGGRVKGLGILRGRVKRFRFPRVKGHGSRVALKIPHMGWNNIAKNSPPKADPPRAERRKAQGERILRGVPDGAYMYFVHSYYVEPRDESCVLATTDYGMRFTSGVWKDNIYGFQFHPEKSQKIGLKILSNFVRL